MRSASAGLTRRGVPFQKIMLSAQAPSSWASWASSRRVRPQTLTLGGAIAPPSVSALRHGLVERRRALAQRDGGRLLVLAAEVGQRHLVAGLLVLDQAGQVVGALDRLAVDLGHEVTAERDRRAAHLRGDVAALQPRLVGGRALLDALHQRALAGRQVQLRQRAADGQRAPAEPRALDLARLLELAELLARGVDRDGEADADVPAAAAAGLDLRVDADDLAGRVEQRAARVAGVDRRVGLDDVVDLEAVGRLDLALQRGDHAGGQGPVEAERVADGDRRVADLHGLGRAEAQRVQVQAVGVDLQQRDVAGDVLADDLRVDGLVVRELHGHLDRAVDDMRVGEDVAVAVDDEAGAGRLALLLGRSHVEGRLRALDDLRADEDHARRVALVDVARRELPGAVAGRARGGDGSLLDDGRRRLAVRVDTDREQQDRDEPATHQAADQRES